MDMALPDRGCRGYAAPPATRTRAALFTGSRGVHLKAHVIVGALVLPGDDEAGSSEFVMDVDENIRVQVTSIKYGKPTACTPASTGAAPRARRCAAAVRVPQLPCGV